jgi:glycosyltransferase involved in cell wall biosynthesis
MRLSKLIFISPHRPGAGSLPSRPASLLSAFIEAGAFDEVILVNRLRPTAFLRHVGGGRPIWHRGLAGVARRLANGAVLIEHPWPSGGLERRFLGGLLAATASRSELGVVAWVADPKSVPGVVEPSGPRRRWRVVVDAYDAWDRSPLVRGERRLRAVADGYRAAATGADLVFTNTTVMRERLAELGATDVRVLPNASPPLETGPGSASDRPAGVVYVGRIHERFDAELADAVAGALPEATITIAGPLEREPVGWSVLAAKPNVRLPGRVGSRAARELIGAAAALIVPHRVDEYTRSQDAMKAWDAIASGTAVVSTPIPPVDGWPEGLAEVCPDTDTFVAAARRAVDGQLEAGRTERRAFAAANQWSARAAVAIAAIADLVNGAGDGPS